jgi:site-specific DNA-methyltransferase (cytosine-N4-specific)
LKRFVCKARLIRKEGYTGIFVTKKGLYLKLPYKDLEVGEITSGKMEVNKIYQGHTPEVLKTFPDDSIDCVVTSPPYWSLRDYKLEPQIWDGDESCKHEWGGEIIGGEGYNNTRKRWQHNKSRESDPETWNKEINQGNFCSLCGAWRGSLGLEPTFELYLKHLIQIFDEIKRVLKPTGTCFVNLGDCYSGSGGDHKTWHNNEAGFQGKLMRGCQPIKSSIPAKSLCAIPERFKIMMIDRGWICRNTIIWYKRNCMPSSANDRFTVDFEYVYFFVKNQKYWFEQQFESQIDWGLRDRSKGKRFLAGIHSETGLTGQLNPQGRNKRCVWDVTTQPYSEAHFATFPEKLVEPMIRAGCPEDGITCDPFGGSGTVVKVAKRLKRNWIYIDLSSEYIKMAKKRIKHVQMELL